MSAFMCISYVVMYIYIYISYVNHMHIICMSYVLCISYVYHMILMCLSC